MNRASNPTDSDPEMFKTEQFVSRFAVNRGNEERTTPCFVSAEEAICDADGNVGITPGICRVIDTRTGVVLATVECDRYLSWGLWAEETDQEIPSKEWRKKYVRVTVLAPFPAPEPEPCKWIDIRDPHCRCFRCSGQRSTVRDARRAANPCPVGTCFLCDQDRANPPAIPETKPRRDRLGSHGKTQTNRPQLSLIAGGK